MSTTILVVDADESTTAFLADQLAQDSDGPVARSHGKQRSVRSALALWS